MLPTCRLKLPETDATELAVRYPGPDAAGSARNRVNQRRIGRRIVRPTEGTADFVWEFIDVDSGHIPITGALLNI